MKKIVCEICGSQTFKKENGNFVCKQCGTEYSADEAKKLLKDVGEELISNTSKAENYDFDKLKLEYDLLCWHLFYKKCHELEKSFVIEDDFLSKCPDISSKSYAGDITRRKLTFDKSNKRYFKQKVLPICIKDFLKSSPSFQVHYEEDKTYYEKEVANDHNLAKAKMKESKAELILGIIFSAVAIVLCIVGISLDKEYFSHANSYGMIYSKYDYLYNGAIACFVIFPILLIIAIILFVFCHKRKDDSEYYGRPRSFISFEEWRKEEGECYENFPEYHAFVSEKEKIFLLKVSEQEKNIVKNRDELAKIRELLIKELSIPEKYTDEYCVNVLLALVLNKRADTLKEAINLFEDELYKSKIISILSELTYNIQVLNKNIIKFKNDIAKQVEDDNRIQRALFAQNDLIIQQISQVSFDVNCLELEHLYK